MPLDIKKTLDEIQAQYTKRPASNSINVLLLGDRGTGKTSLLQTGRMPLLVDSFDPGGTKVFRKELIGKSIFIRNYEEDRSTKPTEYARWEAQWEKDCRDGLLDGIGTYAIDSFTTFLQALGSETAKKKGRLTSNDGILAIQDYQVIGNVLRDIVKICSSKGCDFVLTGHLETDKDDETGVIRSTLKTFKSMKVDIPLLFDETWVMQTKEGSKGIDYKVLTRNTGRIAASTRMGSGGKFEALEEPDIKKLLRKAGMSDKDKEI